MRVRYDEGVAIHVGPEPCVSGREARGEASAGDRAGQPSSRDKVPWFRMPTLLPKRKAARARAQTRAPGRSGVVRDPGIHARSWHGNREISRPTTGPQAVWSASGRRGAVAEMMVVPRGVV